MAQVRRGGVALVVVVAAVLGACGGGDGEDAAACRDLDPLGRFGEVTVEIEGDELCVLLAQTPDERRRGLMDVTDLEGYAGMLFAYPDDVSGGFWMFDTPMPLSIAYLDGDGRIVSSTDMAPCEASADCPSYPPEGPYRFALEVPQGELDDLGLTGDATLEIRGDTNPR